jgi:hypothetical protein
MPRKAFPPKCFGFEHGGEIVSRPSYLMRLSNSPAGTEIHFNRGLYMPQKTFPHKCFGVPSEKITIEV